MDIIFSKPKTKQGIIAKTIAVLIIFTLSMAAVTAIVTAVIGPGPIHSLKDSFNLDSATTAMILTKKPGKLKKTCYVTYQFEADGTQYTGPIYDDVTVSNSCLWKLSKKVRVIYDSANPAHNTLAAAEILVGTKTVFYLTCLSLPLLWVVGIIARIYRTRRWLAELETTP